MEIKVDKVVIKTRGGSGGFLFVFVFENISIYLKPLSINWIYQEIIENSFCLTMYQVLYILKIFTFDLP